jgi:hypothetical protein
VLGKMKCPLLVNSLFFNSSHGWKLCNVSVPPNTLENIS